MTIRYPNGKPFKPNLLAQKSQASSKPIERKEQTSFSNRGKTLEDEINDTNHFYKTNKLAIIHKKPVPIQIVKVEYPSRSAAVIKEAYFRTPSTTDYNGVWNGYYIDFEAKETESKTSFPLKNIHTHQITHMQEVKEQNGIPFMIVRFSSLERYFLLPIDVIMKAWSEMEKGGRKSIPLKTIEQHAYELELGIHPKIDYLSVLEKLLPKI